MEPSLLRNCPLGSGPEYRWTIWDKNGQEVPLSSTRLDTPSLLVHPVYDHNWPNWLRTDKAKKTLGLVFSLPQEEERLMMGVIAPRSLEDGEYTTQLTVKERGTIVQASYNTTFSVVATRLRATFVDGTEREVDRDANVTLRVEVTSPSPNFTVSFDCSPLDAPFASCFTEANKLSSFPTTTNLGENLFSRLQHLWELLRNTSSSDSSSSSSSSGRILTKSNPYTSHHFLPPLNRTSSPFYMHDDSHFLHKVFNTSQHYIVSLTFPASTLVATHKRFRFRASIRKDHKHRVRASQVVSISSPRDNIGIQTCLGSQFPFGALRRMVFESECMSCSPEELVALRYTWRLKMLVKSQNAPVLNLEQQTAASKAEVILHRILRQTEVDESFFPRPSDYLRVYNKSVLQERPTQTAPEEDSNPDPALSTFNLTTHDLQNLPEIIAPEILHQATEIYHRFGRPSATSLAVVAALHKPPTTDLKQNLGQDNPRAMVTVANISPLQAADDPGKPSNDLGREGVRVSRSAPAATHHAQRRQMRKSDRTSSSQTNMRRKVVSRHSGEAAQGPVTDEAAPPASASPTAPAPAFIKVTLDNHHSHLVHRAAHIPPQGMEAEKVKDPAAHSPTEGWLSGSSQSISASPETEDQAGHTNLDHPHRTKRNSGAEKMADEDPWLATVQRVDHGESRRSGVKWEAMGKVFDGEKAARQHQVIPSKGKVQENEYLKIIEEEEEKEKEKKVKEKENRLWWANDGDHRVRDNPHDGGSDRKEERRPMTEAGVGGVAGNARRGLEDDAEHTTVKSPPDAPAEMRKTAATQTRSSEARPRRAVIRQEASPLDSSVPIELDALTKAAVKREGRFPLNSTSRPGPPLQAAAAREGQEADHLYRLVPSRRSRPPKASPLSVASRSDNKERDQFSFGTDHDVRGSEGLRLSALQRRRGTQGGDRWEGDQTTKTIDQLEQRAELQRFSGRVKKRRKKEKLKMMSKPEQREGRKDKGRREMRGGDVSGDAAPRHAKEQEVGYKENYLTSGGDVKVDEDDANDAHEAQNDVGSASEARQVARTSRPPAHQHSDSAHTAVSLSPGSPAGWDGAAATAPEALAAAGLPWDERERRQSTVRGGSGGVRSPQPTHSFDTPRPQPDPTVSSSSAPSKYQDIPFALPLDPDHSPNFKVLDYHEYKKLYMAQPDRRKIDSHATSGPDRSTGNPTRKAGERGNEGRTGPYWPPSRRTDGKAPNHTAEDGMGKAGPASQSSHARLGPADHLAEERGDALSLGLSPPDSRPSSTTTTSVPTGTAQYTTQKSPGWNAVEAAGGDWGVGSGLAGPRGFPRLHPPPREGQAWASRGPGYMEDLLDFVQNKGRLPNMDCRREKWEECDAVASSADSISETIANTLGNSSSDSIMPKQTQDRFVTDESQINVFLFGSLTSTGIHNSVLVLYMDLLVTSQMYTLYLDTHNTLTNNTGSAEQLIEFSPAPTLKHCQVIPLPKTKRSYFRASCSDVEGHFYPEILQWSYRFLSLGLRTVFYYGARTSFDFTLPPGMDSNDYKIYISVKAIDGKGVSYKYPDLPALIVPPRSISGDGVLLIFQEISTIENESPPLLLQQVRSLAWELNILKPSFVTQTVLDNILTMLFYRTSCKDILEGTPSPSSLETNEKASTTLFIKVNLLKSCARDHLAEKVVSNPMRDEMEVIQALTALQVILDANENISSTTYLRVMSAMNIAAERMWFSYFAEIRTEAAQEYFILTSAMLDKQTEIYDDNTTSIDMTTNIITQLLNIMEIETSARFMEEKPLTWSTNTLIFYGYWAVSDSINKWNNTVPFLFEAGSVVYGEHLVQALVHTESPFHLPLDPITSEVIYLSINLIRDVRQEVVVRLRHSYKRAGQDYNFRRDGMISPESLSVYEFVVENEQRPLVFNVLLEVTRVLNSQYPVAAVVLICNDLQSLKDPLYKQELMATVEPSVMLSIPQNGLSTGKKLLIIMDKNSYENNWGRYNTSSTVIGADFKVSAWWSRCLVWDGSQWDSEPCSVNSKLSSWDYTTCRCNSKYTVYGAQTIPVLDEESKVDVNEMMLHETYIALYFIMLLLVIYFLLALAVQTSDRHRLRRRNIWLRDNKLEHEWAYLLTIKTGTQWNAGTTSKVYAILHGTHGMSETRELQSKQTGQLFTRGALCTFILTTPEPLGDILKVQVWHDNSGGSESGWFVCETSVADLVLGAIYIYPCYRWLSVQAEDAKVEREITLESPTTFMQDFEHFLPQYASEHMLWTSLLTTSSTAKLYRLQRLTICLIVCLCLGTVSLGVVKRINNEHTMMVPDMHIESLYFGVIIAVVLLPVQWVLEMIFKMSNKVEEKEYNAKAVLDTLRASKSDSATSTSDTKSTQIPSDNEEDIYDPQAEIWRNLRKWSLSTEVSSSGAEMFHPTLLRDLEAENMEVTQRPRSSSENTSRVSQSDSGITTIQPESLPSDPSVVTEPNEIDEPPETSDKKCSAPFFRVLPKFKRTQGSCCASRSKAKSKQDIQEDWEVHEDEDYDDEEEAERDDLRVASSITFIFSQCVGWIMCCIFVALCCMVLYVYGSGMPMDYAALWIHIIYVTLCCSVFIMQPLVVIIYTFYKVCVYRWLGCRGCISSCITVPLDQVVDIWNRYQTALQRQTPTTPDTSDEKLLEERQRTRELRSAHPPSEDYLLKCREKEIRREKVYGLFQNTLGHIVFLVVLIIIANNENIYTRFTLNEAILSSLKNGSCLDSARYVQDGDTNTQTLNKDYLTFDDIKSKDDWWSWAYTELLALTYSNHDESFSAYKIFCDSNSIIIGQPRLRKYDSSSQECEASKFNIDSNRSLADLLKIGNCFPDYVDNVPHLFSFDSSQDKEYEWDVHFLAVTHGQYGQYSYTSYKQALSSSQFGAVLMLYLLQGSNWLDNNVTRAVVTEFTLYHPQTNMYTTLNLLTEFPSLSGAKVTTFISSSHIERYGSSLSVACMLAETLLLAVAMYYLKRAAVYIYTSRFRIFRSFWGFLDVVMTILSWSYIVCLMLRVQIAEDAMWQLRVAYFQKFVNLKGLTTWDEVLDYLIGGMLTVHLLRCLSLLKYLPRSYHLGLVVASAWKDVKIISVCMLVLLIALMSLGHIWFSTLLWGFHSHIESVLTIIEMIMARLPFMRTIEEQAAGFMTYMGYLYYLLTYIFLYQLIRALYVAAFLNAQKAFIDKPGLDVTWNDITLCVKERYHSLLRRIQCKKKEEESQPSDNTPPDFYMAELELQINQVMSGLESLAESLGVVADRMNRLEDTHSSYSDLHNSQDDNYSYTNDEVWQQEDSDSRSSIYRNDEETRWEFVQQQAAKDYDSKMETNHYQGARPRLKNDSVKGRKISVDRSINFDAFTDIESCPTEIEALTQKWNLALDDPSFELVDDGGTLEKFLKDVSESFDNFTSFGKYGKTQLRVNTRIHPSHESLNLSQNNSGVTGSIAHQKGIHADNVDGSVPRGISSRLCRTQTQGRGKGHVEALDISYLESDHENESNY